MLSWPRYIIVHRVPFASPYIRVDDPDLPAFYFGPHMNSISVRGVWQRIYLVSYEDGIFEPNGADDDDLELPPTVPRRQGS